MTASVLVLGAGLFGATAAAELARRGHAVTLVDAGQPPHPQAASTDLSKAVRCDYGSDLVNTQLAERALDGWRAWQRDWGEQLFHEHGWLFLTRTPLERTSYERDSLGLLRQRGHPVARLGQPGARELPDVWAPGVHVDGYDNRAGGWVESGRVMEWLVSEARPLGVQVLAPAQLQAWCMAGGEQVPVGQPLPAAPLTGCVLAAGPAQASREPAVPAQAGRVHHADVVIVAAGSWTPSLLPHTACFLRVSGQPVFHFRPPDPQLFSAPRFLPWAADITRTGYYGFPLLRDGTVKLAHHGPGRPAPPGATSAVPEADVVACRRFLREALPALASAPLERTRLCPYCDTPDGQFLIDHDPERPGLLVATGGSGHAFKFAPLLGSMVADVVERRPDPHGGRFAWRTGRAAGQLDPARAPRDIGASPGSP